MFNQRSFAVFMIVFLGALAFGSSPVIDGLVKHIDAGAITGLSDGDPVSIVTDLAGIQDMIQVAADNQPVYVSNGINGLPVIRFDGSNDFLRAVDDTTNIFSGDQQFIIFAVCSIDTFGGGVEDRSLVALGREGISGDREVSILAFENASTTGNRLYGGWPHWTTSIAAGTPVLVENAYSGGGQESYTLALDGSAITPGIFNNNNPHAFTASTMTLGYTAPGSGNAKETTHFDGDVAEIMVFNRTLSAGELNLVGYHLASKYGLTTTYSDPGAYTVATAPQSGSTNLDPSAVIFEWQGRNLAGGEVYELEYVQIDLETSTPIGSPVVIATSEENYTPTDLLMGATYQWSVSIQGGFDGFPQIFTCAGKVSIFDPIDGDAAIEQDASISWSETNVPGRSYKVYLGKTDPPSFVAEVTGTDYIPSTALDPNSLYYCRIDTVRGSEEVPSDVISFMTGGFARNPYPADGAANAPTGLFIWEGDRVNSYMDSYDIYMGDTPETLAFLATVSEPEYELSTDLGDGVTKYWKVVGKHDGVAIDAYEPVWSFTTGKLLAYCPLESNTDPNFAVTTAELAGSFVPNPALADGADPNVYLVEGIVGDAVRFGGDNLLELKVVDANSSYWDGTGDAMTIAMWAKWKVADNYPTAYRYGPFVSKNNANEDTSGWSLQFNSYYNRTQLRTNGSTMTASDGMFVESDKWHFHCVTHSPIERQYFVDGQLHRGPGYDLVPAYEIAGAPVCIGGRIKEDGAWQKGVKATIDEVRIYDRVLSENQMLDLYKNSPMAKLPQPETSSVDAPYDGVFAWTPGDIALGVEKQRLIVSLSRDLSSPIIDTILAAEDTYDIAGNLELETTYYWRVDSLASDESLIWQGDVWNFTTQALAGDIVINKIVDMDDLQGVASEWLSDTRSIPTEDLVIKWTEYADLADFFIPRLSVYGNSWAELELNPQSDPNHTVAVSRTVKWWCDADESDYESSRQYECNFRFMESIDLNHYETITLWVRPWNVMTNGYHHNPSWLIHWFGDPAAVWASGTQHAVTPEGDPISWTDASAANDGAGKWVKMVYNVGGGTNAWTDMEFWFNQSGTQKDAQAAAGDFYFEFGEMVLTPKTGLTDPVCHLGVTFSDADFNQDCDVDLYDFAAFGANWMKDAN